MTDSQLALGGSVIVKLADCLPPADDKYTLYFDNFFTSLNLLEFLSIKNIQATRTVQANVLFRLWKSSRKRIVAHLTTDWIQYLE